MRMRESVRSLQAYFIVIGLITGARAVASFQAPPLAALVAIVTLALAIAYLYVGVRLKHLLMGSPRQVVAVLIASGALAGIGLVISVFALWVPEIFWASVQLLITWYLYTNVRRLSAEAVAASPSD